MDVIACAVHLYQLRLEVHAHFGENMPEGSKGLAIEDAAAVFGHEDQMNVQGENAMSTVPQVLAFVHRRILLQW